MHNLLIGLCTIALILAPCFVSAPLYNEDAENIL
jgi:hypothetical protein